MPRLPDGVLDSRRFWKAAAFYRYFDRLGLPECLCTLSREFQMSVSKGVCPRRGLREENRGALIVSCPQYSASSGIHTLASLPARLVGSDRAVSQFRIQHDGSGRAFAIWSTIRAMALCPFPAGAGQSAVVRKALASIQPPMTAHEAGTDRPAPAQLVDRHLNVRCEDGGEGNHFEKAIACAYRFRCCRLSRRARSSGVTDTRFFAASACETDSENYEMRDLRGAPC